MSRIIGFRIRDKNPIDQIINRFLQERSQAGHDVSDVVREQLQKQMKQSGDWDRIKRELGLKYG